ncbi:ATPase family gene 2 protein homolog A isoform X2 [Rhodnius prolixus]|uniref:ATPase family gene 2 protein homolog A isoform X2 n=1 Tax=Rhodnius prolixus TaxID=13249 RepID=UPI003D18E36D
MPRKGRKSVSLWNECENCACIINAKDLELHASSCPPNEDKWNHSFIKQQTLYSSCEDIDERALPLWMRADTVEDMIFLSQSVMQICGFIIGFPLVIWISEKKIIKRAWPSIEGCLTSAMLLKEALEYDWDNKDASGLIKVSKLDILPKLASEIYFRITNIEEELINFEELSLILRNRLKEKILFLGNKIHIRFYGKKIVIQIMDCKHYNADISNEMLNLSLDEITFSSDENTEFICTNKNKWENIMSYPQNLRFGGYGSLISELKQNMSSVLKIRSSLDDVRCTGILLYGIHGSGKTLAMQYLVSFFNAHVMNIQGMEMFSKYYGETEGKLRSSFQNAIKNAPSIILLDNVEVLCPRKGSDQERRIISTFLSLFDSIQNKNIVVLASSSRPDNIEPSLRRPGRLEIEIEIPVPSVDDRTSIMKALLPDSSLNETIRKVAEISHGFVAADLTAVVSKAKSKAALEGRNVISTEDLTWAHSQVMPSAMREVCVQVPNVKWSDIAGEDGLKLKLQQCVEWPIKYPECFTRLGIKSPRGVLLYGPPGCSKTMIAKAIATESQLNFLSIKALLRPGRLDRIIYVPLPDHTTRKQLFELQFKKMPVETLVNSEQLATQTKGYSGAEVVAVCNEAAFKALEESIHADIVRMDHFESALQIVAPRTPESLLKLYEDYMNKKESSALLT